MLQPSDVALQGAAFITRCALEPLISGPLVALLLYSPSKPAGATLHASLSRYIDCPNAPWVLGLLFAVGMARKLNRILNSWATNNWKLHAGRGWDWPSEVAVVTGGCSNIGQAIAHGLTSHGIRVAALDVQDAPPDVQANGLITFFRCDIASPAAIAETADAIRRIMGAPPSILVNNAGITGSHTILATPSAFLDRIFQVNMLSHWRLVQQFVPAMIAGNKGHIVTIASVNSFLTNAANADYVATKAAALAFHEGLTSELKIWYKAPGVKTTIVHPSWVRTPLVEDMVRRSGQDEVVLDRMLQPEEVADVVVRQVIKRRGAQLFVPRWGAAISWLKGMPNWVQEMVREAFGRSTAVTGGSIVAR